MWYVPGEPQLSLGLLARALRKEHPLSPEKVTLFSHARHAISQYITERDLAGGPFYVPSYICAQALTPLESFGQDIRYYPVNEDLEPDWDWLGKEPALEHGSLLLVHYFGFPNAIDQAQRFCRERNLALIEDCAHSFLTKWRGRTIGTFGEAGVYSYRKLLPLPDGAGLIQNEPPGAVSPPSVNGRSPHPTPRTVLKKLVKHGLCKVGVPMRIWDRYSGRNGADTEGIEDGGPQRPLQMSAVSRKIMHVLEPSFQEVIERRRENYGHLARSFLEFPEATLWQPELPEGVCPYLFPFLVPDRDEVLRRFRSRGVRAQPWPNLPREVSAAEGKFKVALYYADRLIGLPVHQDIGPNHVDYMVEAYKQLRTTAARK